MTVCVLGGDFRLAHAARKLSELGCEVYACGLSKCPVLLPAISLAQVQEKADAVVLPFPYSKDQQNLDCPYGVEGIPLDALHFRAGTRVFCGRCDLPMRARAEEAGWILEDFCLWESFLASSAVLTAEGALWQTMQHSKRALCRQHALVIGFGRIARHLCHLLYACGVRVRVCARKARDRAQAARLGYEACDFPSLEEAAAWADYVYNTVPSAVFLRQALIKTKEDVLIIDLASPPGGVDFTAAKELHRSYLWALALPSSYAPITAGEDLGEAIFHALQNAEKKGRMP